MRKAIWISIITSLIITLIVCYNNLKLLIKNNYDGVYGIIGFIIAFLFVAIVVASIIFGLIMLIKKIIKK